MYDIHHHLLFGLDDGPKDLESAVAQANMAADDGITHIVCTPHASGSFRYKPEENAAKLDELRARVGHRVQLGIGCDFHLSYENMEDAQQNRTKYTINGGPYLLIEFPDFGIPPQITEALYELRVRGMTLIVTHPERNATLQTRPEMLLNFLRAGHLVQVTAGAVEGKFGRTAARSARELLEKRWVNFLATDAHDTERRPPRMSPAREIVERDYGKEYADLLCVENPRAVWEGRELGAQPEMTGVFLDEEPREAKGFFRRIFSR